MKSSFSLLPYQSLESFLKDQLGLSGQWIKRHSQFSKDLLKKNDVHARTYDCELNLINSHMINPLYRGPEIFIIYEDEDLVVVNKPEKIHGHPLCYEEYDNVLSFLRSIKRGNSILVNQSSHERGLLYRLDYETSGVLIIAKNQKTFERYFKRRMKKKLYFALVKPGLNKSGDIRAYFKSCGPKGERMMAYTSFQDGAVEGLTRIDILKQSVDFDLVALELYDGHRHQLRSLMASLGHPILGDKHYGEQSHHARLMLHASQYIIEDDACVLDFRAPLQGEFKDLLNLHGLLQVFHDQFNVS